MDAFGLDVVLDLLAHDLGTDKPISKDSGRQPPNPPTTLPHLKPPGDQLNDPTIYTALTYSPGRNNIDPDPLHPTRPPETPHQCPPAVLRDIVLRRPRLVHVAGNAGFDNQAAITGGVLGLALEVMHGKFDSVDDADEVGLEDAEVGLGGLIGGVCVGEGGC